MSGFAAIYRKVCEHPLFRNDSSRLGAWVWLVVSACWKPTEFDISGKTVTIRRGQICASRSQLARAWGWSPSAVERFLTRLETEQMIERATGQGRSIITICNYENYQSADEQAGQATGQATGQPPDSHRTAKEQGNKGTIDSPPTPQGGRRGKAVIPKDWTAPPIADLPPKASQCARQWPAGKYETHAEAFHSYWLSERRMKADWRLTWANRVVSIHDQVMRSANFASGNRGPPGLQSSTPFLDHMRRKEQAQ